MTKLLLSSNIEHRGWEVARDKSNPDHFHVSTFSHLLTSAIVRVWFLLGAGRLCFQAYLDEITRSNKLFLVVYSRKDRSPNYKKRLEKKKERKEGRGTERLQFFPFLSSFRCSRSSFSSFRNRFVISLHRKTRPVVSSKRCNERERSCERKGATSFFFSVVQARRIINLKILSLFPFCLSLALLSFFLDFASFGTFVLNFVPGKNHRRTFRRYISRSAGFKS